MSMLEKISSIFSSTKPTTQTKSLTTTSRGEGFFSFAKYPLLFLCILSLAVSAFAVHTSTANLEPEWTAAGQAMDYTVTICNEDTSADEIDEVRIYQNSNYESFVADSKDGWYLGSYNPIKKYYPYTANDSSSYINPDECTDFTFSATTKTTPIDTCQLSWKFETRDVTQTWRSIYDYTSIDSDAPQISKDIIGPQKGPCPPGQGEECWVMDHETEVAVQVTDDIAPECNSGIDSCTYTITLDGVLDFEHTFNPDDPTMNMGWGVTFGEDSVHELTITCVDVAGNEVTDTEVFRVDSTPPETDKEFFGPQKVIDGAYGPVEWIDGVTTIRVAAEDPDPTEMGCNIGVENTFYKITPADDSYCWNSCLDWQTSTPTASGEGWDKYTGPIGGIDESCHVMEYYSVDELGNIEGVNTNCFFVDKTPPFEEKWIGEPAIVEAKLIEDGEKMYVIKVVNPTDSEITADLILEQLKEDGSWTGVEDEDVCTAISEDISYYFDPYWGSCNGIGGGCGPDFVGQTWEEWLAAHPDWMDWYVTESGCAGSGDETVGLSWSNGELVIPGQTIPANSTAWGVVKTTAKISGNYRYSVKEGEGLEFYLGGLKEEDTIWAQDHVTPVILTCEDQEPHPSGDEEVCYKVSFDLDPFDLTSQYCEGDLETIDDAGYEGTWCCASSTETIVFKEDSKHGLEYFCRDAVNKKSNIDLEWFRVDSVAPKITKTMIGDDHLGECPPRANSTEPCYVRDSGQNGVHVAVSDPDPTEMECNVDQTTCSYQLWWKGNVIDSDTFGEEGVDIIFTEDSEHTLVINCEDALGNKMEEDVEVFLVDSTPPETTKDYGTPTKVKDGYRWITGATPIDLNAVDEKVGVKEISYRVTLQDLLDYDCMEQCPGTGNGSWTTISGATTQFTIPEQSCHFIEFYSTDLLGNTEVTNSQCVFVDNTEPEVNKVIGQPQVTRDDGLYISRDTPVTLSCTDAQPHPSNDVSLWYKYRVSNDCENWGRWTQLFDSTGPEVEKTIYFPEDSCHELEYYCEDILGNTTEVYNEIDIVDTQGPVINKTVVGPQIGDCPPQGEGDSTQGDGDSTTTGCFIDGVTEIHVDAVDPEPHPVNDVYCDWSYAVLDGTAIGGEAGVRPPFVINFPEESKHGLWIECYDALGNETSDYEEFLVDKTPPGFTKRYVGPYESYTFENYWAEWINSTTEIIAGVKDDGPHKSGIKEVKYRTTRVDDEYCRQYEEGNEMACEDAEGSGDWVNLSSEDFGEFQFSIGEDSCHLIEIFAEDNVDKNATHKQCVFVDNQAPVPDKQVGEPREVWDGLNSIYYPEIGELCGTSMDCWTVTLMTPIDLACNDPDPHPVGDETVCFYVELDGDNATGDYCDEYGGNIDENGFCCMDQGFEEFYFQEESEHNLQYYCVDALGNTGPIDDEKFKVRGTAFEIELNKKWNLISVPFVLLDNNIETVLESVDENVDSVWTYDAFIDQWYVYHPESPETSNLETMEPGIGYWLAALEDDTLVIGGSLFSPATTPPDRSLKTGWNLIGYYGTDGMEEYTGPWGNGKEAGCALFSLGSSFFDKGWTSLLTYWEPDNPSQWSEFGYGSNMDPGAGYWISVPEDGQYSYTTNCGFFI